MRRRSLLVIVAVLMVVAVLGAAAAGPAAAAPNTGHCNFVVAGKQATTDGSVMMCYNNDWATSNYQYLQVVPASGGHFQYVKLLTSGGVAEGGINVHQLGVLYGTATTLDKSVLAADPYVKKGFGGEIWDTILQTCTTAKQAIDLLAQDAQTGFNVGAAGSFAIGDPSEVWVFELLGGHHWVAVRVPDNAYMAHPNTVLVQQVNLSDPANYRGSSDLQSFAQSIGRYSPSDGPFNVAWAYADRTDLQSYLNTNRMWAVVNKWTPSLGCVPAMTFATRPVFAVPSHLLTRQDLMAICRDHFEGTSLDQTQNYTLMNPNAQTDRPICYKTTDYSAAWQLRSWLPDNIGGVMWVACGRPDTSAYVPYYDCVTSVPAAFTSKTAFGSFEGIATTLDKSGTIGGTTHYGYNIGLVRSTFGGFETTCTNAQASTETTAAGKTGADQVTYLTSYSTSCANQALSLAQGLAPQLK